MSLREIGLPTPVLTGRRGRYLQLTFCFPWAELADFFSRYTVQDIEDNVQYALTPKPDVVGCWDAT